MQVAHRKYRARIAEVYDCVSKSVALLYELAHEFELASDILGAFEVQAFNREGEIRVTAVFGFWSPHFDTSSKLVRSSGHFFRKSSNPSFGWRELVREDEYWRYGCWTHSTNARFAESVEE